MKAPKTDRQAYLDLLAQNLSKAEQLRLDAEQRFLNAKENARLAQRFASIKPAPRRSRPSLFQRLIGA